MVKIMTALGDSNRNEVSSMSCFNAGYLWYLSTGVRRTIIDSELHNFSGGNMDSPALFLQRD